MAAIPRPNVPKESWATAATPQQDVAKGSLATAATPQQDVAKGVLGNSGNTMTGRKKKAAGKRCGVRRSAKRALVLKKRWLDLILAGQKTWEIRGSSTGKRGWIHFAESQAGGELRGILS